jgi:hypothetical protein
MMSHKAMSDAADDRQRWSPAGFDPPKREDALRPVAIQGVLDRDKFLDELNDERNLPARVFKPRPGFLGNSASARAKVDSMGAQLRFYIDEWLDTGKTKSGIEDPKLRDITMAPSVCWAIRSFADREPLRLEPAAEGVCVRFPSEKTLSLFASPGEGVVDRANRFLSLFFLCDWRSRLAKCQNTQCGRYFELTQSKRIYKRGTFCSGCRRVPSQVSAVSRTRQRRYLATQALYSFAAKRFSGRIRDTPAWFKDPKLKSQITHYLNGKIDRNEELRGVYHGGVRQGITEKWLGWRTNSKGIERAVGKPA